MGFLPDNFQLDTAFHILDLGSGTEQTRQTDRQTTTINAFVPPQYGAAA